MAKSTFPFVAILLVVIANPRARKTKSVQSSTNVSILVKYVTGGRRNPRVNRYAIKVNTVAVERPS